LLCAFAAFSQRALRLRAVDFADNQEQEFEPQSALRNAAKAAKIRIRPCHEFEKIQKEALQ
jgi:hypothetical protein